ncbi:glycosyltransferase family 4 protein [candidate division KSB1 bacterium]
MKIAVFSSTINVRNGYGNITYEYCSELVNQGFEVTLFLPSSEKKYSKNFKFSVEYLLPPYIFRFFTPKVFSYIFCKIDLSDYDIVHSLFAFPYAIIVSKLSKKYKKPFIVGAQGTYGVEPLTHFFEGFFLKRAYSQADAFIVPSKFTKKEIERYSKKQFGIKVIHNGVNLDRFLNKSTPDYLKKKYAGKDIVMTVGGLKKRKGQDTVIKALPSVVEKVPKIHYIMVGSGSEEEYLKKLAYEYNVERHIEFVGEKEGKELVDYFYLCDIYIHTPKVVNLNFEGFGIVYLEASACKKPIIGTYSGGVEDAVVDNKTGFLFHEEDINGISSKIIELFNNKEDIRKIGEEGFLYAKKHDWSDIVHEYKEVYMDVFNKYKNKPVLN